MLKNNFLSKSKTNNQSKNRIYFSLQHIKSIHKRPPDKGKAGRDSVCWVKKINREKKPIARQ